MRLTSVSPENRPRTQLKEIFQIIGRILASVLTVAVLSLAGAKTVDAQLPDTSSAISRVFVDCPECDADYLRQELKFVNFVRDRGLAELAAMITSLPTASGGRAFRIDLQRVSPGSTQRDSAIVHVAPDATQDEQRKALVRVLKLSLVPFLRGTAVYKALDVTYDAAAGAASAAREANDPWNQWVFRLSASGSFAGDDNYSARGGDGSASASRTTDALKIEVVSKGSFNREKFRLSDGETLESDRHSWSIKSLIVRSSGDHFSIGLNGSAISSVFQNTRIQLQVMPAVEYDMYPYREATQRQLVIRYGIGIRAARYSDTTIYGRIAESRPVQELSAAADVRQPWGAVWGSALWSQYLHDTSKRRLTINTGADWRIIAGLSLNIGVYYSLTRDQLNIPGSNLSNEERLLRLRELQSGYSVSGGIGLSYTFGSVFSNIVNPRFRL
jgi:hypothetical protein